MDNKLLVLCLMMAFIIGMYTAVLITKDRACTVTYSKDHEVSVLIGSR